MVKSPDVVFQTEAAAPVKFNAADEVMSVELMVMVEPMVAVAVYKFAHLAEAEPML